MDVDAAVYAHVTRTLGERLTGLELDEDDEEASVSAVARLKQECVEAREALSSDTDASIPVLMPGLSTSVRLTRAELETMVRPALYSTVEALLRALRSAAVAPDDLRAGLLVGGSSRIPLVAQIVGAELGRPVAVDAEPKFSVALGAAWLAAEGSTIDELTPEPALAPVEELALPGVEELALPAVEEQAPVAAPALPPPWNARRWVGAGAAAAAVVTATASGVWFAMDRNAARPSVEAAAGASTSPTASATSATSRSSATDVPAAVTSLAASRGRPTGSTATSIRVRWAPSAGATSYLVQWREVGGTGSRSATTTSPSFTITGLVPRTRYHVRVTPRNIKGSGAPTTVTGSTALT